MNRIYNPDPAWPEIVALCIAFVLLLSSTMSSWPLSKFLEVNWWPFLRIILWVWVPMRFFDLINGGPSRRAAMRVLYRRWLASVNARAD